MAPEDNPDDDVQITKEEWDATYPDHVHDWFELSYAQFLTVPRLVMQSMSPAWQAKMVDLLKEMDDTFDWRPKDGRYWVQIRDDKGRFLTVDAAICDYRRGSVEHMRIEPRRHSDSETPTEIPDDTEEVSVVPAWQERLAFDFNVSETSPVVKGTWVTVGHVVSLIVDGWTWSEILRTHPELTEDDIRVCVAYTVDQDQEAAGA